MPRRRGLRPLLLAAVIRSNATLAFAERQVVSRILPMKAAIYCTHCTYPSYRPDSNSRADQERRCREFADSNGYEVVAVFADPPVSAEAEGRQGIEELVADSQAGKFDVVVAGIGGSTLIHNVDQHLRHNIEVTAATDPAEFWRNALTKSALRKR